MKREKRLCVLLTFHTTTDAMAAEAYCAENRLPGRLIPVPAIISAGCGMCWSTSAEALADVTDAAKAAGIATDGIYQMML